MGLRRLVLLWVTLVFVGCGDNIHPSTNEGSGGSDANNNVIIDAPVDAAPDAPPDALICNSPTMNCGGQCIDTTNNHDNCGGCGSACDATQVCDNSACTTTCPNGKQVCNGVCVDKTDDPNNCGSCGNMCTNGAVCDHGACVNTCGSGETSCNGACVDVSNNHDNCGSCNHPCALTEVCSSGTCMATCSANQTDCNGSCKDTGNDNNNCGACGNACGIGQTCDQGVCCDAGKTNCNGTCVNEQTDGNNCGSCNNQCGTGTTCDSGVCCGTGTENCSGTCSDPQTDNNNCGACNNACATGSSCSTGLCCTNGTYNSGGICCVTGTFNSGGLCCATGTENCGGTCSNPNTDNSNCGGCGNVCSAGTSCQAGTCKSICASGEIFCNGQCVNPTLDHNNCGGCNINCGAGTCDFGICCAANQANCGGTCQTLGTNTHCSSCSDSCSTGEACKNDLCCPSADNNCNGACSDPQTDNNNCGGCGIACGGGATCDTGKCCPTGTHNDNGLCCPSGQVNCGGVCKDLSSSNSCGTTCGNAVQCPVNTFCDSSTHTCVSSCDVPTPDLCNGTCVDKATDPFNCGTCSHQCPTGGSVCAGGVCGPCPVSRPDLCGTNPGQCVNTETDENNCGTCGHVCGSGQTCDLGVCCDAGTINCGGQCVNTQTDPNNCGGCNGAGGSTCGTGATCDQGQCECPSGDSLCNGACITTVVDPNNCGGCGITCPANKPLCVSNGCTNTCPAPLANCGGKCTNKEDDDNNCGGCGTKCAAGTGCSAGSCVPVITTGPPPAKCVNGGPVIDVPDGSGGSTCTGTLGATAFTFGMCSRTDIGPLSRLLYTDAFDSTQGPYVASCTTSTDCGPKRCIQGGNLCTSNANCLTAGDTCDFPIKCVAGACAGGGVGVNGTTQNSALTHVGGDFWVFGTGESTKGDVLVSERMVDKFSLDYSHTGTVYGSSYINGPFTTGGNSSLTLYGLLTTAANCSTLPGSMTLNGGCTGATAFPPFKNPCGTAADLIPVKTIVNSFRTTNDDATIGITPATLSNVTTVTRLDLPCGIYYFNSIQIGKSTTIVVHGHTAIVVGGAIRVSQELILDLDPGATLDIFVGGVMNVSNVVTLGSPAYPRLSRMYFGDSSCIGSGTLTTGQDYTHCCSGLATGNTCVAGGGNLSQAISLSNGGHFNGLLWAGYGQFTHSNPLEMYGSIFANYIDASGETTVHYDNGIAHNGDECPPPTGCTSCRDCNNQACNGGTCGSCSSDSDCCPPLLCRNGTCVLNE